MHGIFSVTEKLQLDMFCTFPTTEVLQLGSALHFSSVIERMELEKYFPPLQFLQAAAGKCFSLIWFLQGRSWEVLLTSTVSAGLQLGSASHFSSFCRAAAGKCFSLISLIQFLQGCSWEALLTSTVSAGLQLGSASHFSSFCRAAAEKRFSLLQFLQGCRSPSLLSSLSSSTFFSTT